MSLSNMSSITNYPLIENQTKKIPNNLVNNPVTTDSSDKKESVVIESKNTKEDLEITSKNPKKEITKSYNFVTDNTDDSKNKEIQALETKLKATMILGLKADETEPRNNEIYSLFKEKFLEYKSLRENISDKNLLSSFEDKVFIKDSITNKLKGFKPKDDLVRFVQSEKIQSIPIETQNKLDNIQNMEGKINKLDADLSSEKSPPKRNEIVFNKEEIKLQVYEAKLNLKLEQKDLPAEEIKKLESLKNDVRKNMVAVKVKYIQDIFKDSHNGTPSSKNLNKIDTLSNQSLSLIKDYPKATKDLKNIALYFRAKSTQMLGNSNKETGNIKKSEINFNKSMNAYKELLGGYDTAKPEANLIPPKAVVDTMFNITNNKIEKIKELNLEIASHKIDVISKEMNQSRFEIKQDSTSVKKVLPIMGNTTEQSKWKNDAFVTQKEKEIKELQKPVDNFNTFVSSLDDNLYSKTDKIIMSAKIYESQGKFPQAIESYNKARELFKPDIKNVLDTKSTTEKAKIDLKIASCLLADNKTKEAISVLNKYDRDLFSSLNQKSTSPELYPQILMLKAQAMSMRSDIPIEELKKSYQKVIDFTRPDYINGWKDYKGSKGIDDSTIDKMKYLNQEASFGLANSLYSEEKKDQGNKILDNLLKESDPKSLPEITQKVLYAKGTNLLNSDKPQDAFKLFNKVLATKVDGKETHESQLIKKVLSEFIVKDKSGVEQLDPIKKGKNDNWASAAQVLLKVSGGNNIGVSMALAGTGALIGTMITPGVGTAVGFAAGTLIDRVSASYNNWDKVSQSYKTGYENISVFENVMNTVGLALDVVDIVPGAVFATKEIQLLGKGVSRLAFDDLSIETLKAGIKNTSKKSAEYTEKFIEKFVDPTQGLQTKLGLGVLGVTTIQPISNVIDLYKSGKIDKNEFEYLLINSLKDTGQNLASLVGFSGMNAVTGHIGSSLNQTLFNKE